MKIVVRYRCHACGGAATGAGDRAWIECGGCGAVLGFDWMALQRSAEYRRWMGGDTAMGDAIDDYGQALAAADEAAAAGDLEACRGHVARAAALAVEAFPYLFPPRAHSDAGYADAHRAYAEWSMLQQRIDEPLREIIAAMAEATSGLDLADPLPSLMRLADLAEDQAARLDALDGPPDPDGLPLAARTRIGLGLCLGGYLPYVSPAHRVALLERIHGAEQLSVEGDPAGEAHAPFRDWTCPACAMASLQPEAAPLAVCPACALRQALEPGGPGDVEPGVDVAPHRRDDLVVAGLARCAAAFARLITAERFADLIRRSFPGHDRQALGDIITRVGHACAGDESASRLATEARAHLR